MITEWVVNARGEKNPKYTLEQLQRIADAAWRIHPLVPHPDDAYNDKDAANIREFVRALEDLPPLK